MKLIHYIGVLIAALLFASPAMAADAPKVEDALKAWVAAVQSGDEDAVMKLYDNKAIMISTFAQNPMTRRAEIAGYYRKVLVNPDIKVEVTEQHPRIFGNMAINTGRYTLSYTQDGELVSLPARFSFVYMQKNGQWIIVDHHSSRMPVAEEK